MVKKCYEFVKEVFPYIIIGMLATYIYADYKLEGKRLPGSVNMPYMKDEALDNDTIIRNAIPRQNRGQQIDKNDITKYMQEM
ncbi:hypothetical protein [Paraclostridium sordellii]|uniref:hypothetical protein n=1 Tax=Paraclostridium sordellii TaxID=1505 RepID=UPI0022E2DE97|nr:hypothetical protein [Paeniclostridium sordellii]